MAIDPLYPPPPITKVDFSQRRTRRFGGYIIKDHVVCDSTRPFYNNMNAQRFDPTQKLKRYIDTTKKLQVVGTGSIDTKRAAAAQLYQIRVVQKVRLHDHEEDVDWSATLATDASDMASSRSSVGTTDIDAGESFEVASNVSDVVFARNPAAVVAGGIVDDGDDATSPGPFSSYVCAERNMHGSATPSSGSHSSLATSTAATVPSKTSVALEDDINTPGSTYKYREFYRADDFTSMSRYEVYRGPSLASKLTCCVTRSPPPSPTRTIFSVVGAAGAEIPRGRGRANKSPATTTMRNKSPSSPAASRASSPLRHFRSFNCFNASSTSTPTTKETDYFEEWVDQAFCIVEGTMPGISVKKEVVHGVWVDVEKEQKHIQEEEEEEQVPFRGYPSVIQNLLESKQISHNLVKKIGNVISVDVLEKIIIENDHDDNAGVEVLENIFKDGPSLEVGVGHGIRTWKRQSVISVGAGSGAL